jgi:hypothetical protein
MDPIEKAAATTAAFKPLYRLNRVHTYPTITLLVGKIFGTFFLTNTRFHLLDHQQNHSACMKANKHR